MSKLLSRKLSEDEMDELSSILSGFTHEKAMSLEEVDGFFTAIHCSPTMISINHFLSDIWGDETGEEEAPFENIEELNHFLNLLMRFWNDVGNRCNEEIFLPVMELDQETGLVKGNEWARGFLRGAGISGGFKEMMKNENEGGSFIPIFALAHEHDEDPRSRSFQQPLTQEKREEIIAYLSAGVTRIYRYFASHRKRHAKMERESHTIRRVSEKSGRNDPCSCGSGLKYKKCCLH